MAAGLLYSTAGIKYSEKNPDKGKYTINLKCEEIVIP